MTDSPGTITTDLQRTLQPDVSPPSPPAATTPAAPLPAIMTVAEAESRQQEMLRDPSWWVRWNRGDIDANEEFKTVTQVIAYANRPREPSAPDSTEGLVEWARKQADVSEGVIEDIRAGRPVSSYERQLAIKRREARFADPEFVQAYLNGSYDAKKEVFLLSVILASPVRDQQ